ncbi:MAG: 50S ribosomal protein L9 [Candidatus Aerophobetes bacterium]|nr:50S ribosomal protein L9 [Candidatus Aerophobetes bacterium]
MKVILIQDIERLGKREKIVEVNDGYGRNFLLPKKMALRATPANIKQLEEKKRAVRERRERGKLKALKIAEKLKGVRLIIEREVGEEGKLFGAVTSQDIAQEIRKKSHLEIDHRKVNLEEPIKVIGIKKISLKLHPKVGIEVEVEVKKRD